MPSATPPMAPASRGNASSRGNLASSRGSLASSRGNLASSRGASRSSRPRTGAEQQQQLVSSRHSSPRVALSSSRSTPRLPSAEPVEDYRLTQGVRVHRHTGATPYAPGEAKAKLPQDYRNQYTDVTAGQLLDRFDRYANVPPPPLLLLLLLVRARHPLLLLVLVRRPLSCSY